MLLAASFAEKCKIIFYIRFQWRQNGLFSVTFISDMLRIQTPFVQWNGLVYSATTAEIMGRPFERVLHELIRFFCTNGFFLSLVESMQFQRSALQFLITGRMVLIEPIFSHMNFAQIIIDTRIWIWICFHSEISWLSKRTSNYWCFITKQRIICKTPSD